MSTEDSCSYTGNKDRSSTSSCTSRFAQGSVTGFEDVSVKRIEGLLTALTEQPISVAIDTDSVFFQWCSVVVIQFWCGTNLDHAVLAVGYGTDGRKFCGISSRPLTEVMQQSHSCERSFRNP